MIVHSGPRAAVYGTLDSRSRQDATPSMVRGSGGDLPCARRHVAALGIERTVCAEVVER